MIYVKHLSLPSEYAEVKLIEKEMRTCFNSMYPFKIFSAKDLYEVDFDDITIFYGGNGSGKTTLLNILAEKILSNRHSDFNNSPFFKQFTEMSRVEYRKPLKGSQVLTSDDVFDYVLNIRELNEEVDSKRDQLLEKYEQTHRQYKLDHSIMHLNGLEDYERWKETRDIIYKKVSQSRYVKERLDKNVDMFSNGETAMKYFTDMIDEDSLYLMDEPENSLSVEYQLELAEYISASARHFRCQFVIATHSPIFLSLPNARIYNLDEYPVCQQKWTELPNVRKYFEFFMSHKDEF